MSDYQNTILQIFNSDVEITKQAVTLKQVVIIGIFSIIVTLELIYKIPLLYPVSVICALWLFSTMIYSFMKNVDASIQISHINFLYFVLEVALLTMIIHFLGSVVWIGAIFYLIAILYANVVYSWRAGIVVAIVCGISYLGLFMLEANGVIPHYELFSLDPAYATSSNPIGVVTLISIAIGVFLLGIYAVNTFNNIIKQEEKMVEEKKAIISMLNHDLKNYLTLISGYHSFYSHYDDPKLVHANAKIDENIKRIDEILTSAGLYSKIEDPRYEMNIEKLDRGVLVANVIEKFLDKGATKSQEIIFEPDGEFLIEADAFLLSAVFENLIQNAMSYGGGRLEIEIRDDGGAYTLAFRDYGDGIPDEMKNRIFDRFRDARKGAGMKGTGIGLALVRRIVEMHGGKVWVEDNPEGGSIFYIKLFKREGV